jgi:hypothetical protein
MTIHQPSNVGKACKIKLTGGSLFILNMQQSSPSFHQ